MSKQILKRLTSVVLVLCIIFGCVSVSPQVAYASVPAIAILPTDMNGTVTLSSSAYTNSLYSDERYGCKANFSTGGIVKFTLSGASTVETIELCKSGKVIGRYSNYNGYNCCSFTADIAKGTTYTLYFYTTSENSSNTFKCSAALYQDSYVSSVKGCTWYPDNQTNVPSSSIMYTAMEYYPIEQLAILYARQDEDIRNKLMDGTYSAICTLALSYACSGIPALQKAVQKMDDNKLIQVAMAYFGTTSLATIFGGPIFTEIAKQDIMAKSNNFTNGLVRKSYFVVGGTYGETYEAWNTYPYAYAPAGYRGTWSDGVKEQGE